MIDSDKEIYDIKGFEDIIEDIVKIRNFKAENNITNNDEVKVVTTADDSIYKGMLRFKKLTDKDTDGLVYESKLTKIVFFVEAKEEDIEAKNKEIEMLRNSIQRREKLLSNEGYVNKAPANIVEEERTKLAQELEKLQKLLS